MLALDFYTPNSIFVWLDIAIYVDHEHYVEREFSEGNESVFVLQFCLFNLGIVFRATL